MYNATVWNITKLFDQSIYLCPTDVHATEGHRYMSVVFAKTLCESLCSHFRIEITILNSHQVIIT